MMFTWGINQLRRSKRDEDVYMCERETELARNRENEKERIHLHLVSASLSSLPIFPLSLFL